MTVERRDTKRGEIVLRRAGGHFEIISNGTFLMDTRGGTSEREMVRRAVRAASSGPLTVLVAGLGVGFSLAEAVTAPEIAAVTVVEVEPAVLDWHATHLAPFSGGALGDPQVEVVVADVRSWLEHADRRYDVICLDVDNGPTWTVVPENAWLYGTEGLAALRRRLRPGGVLTVWSAGPAPEFAAALRERIGEVTVHPVPVPRGEPDHIYLARCRGTADWH